MLLSQRMRAVQAPVIRIIGDLIRTNPGTISLGQGVVYYGPPQAVHEGIDRFWNKKRAHWYQSESGIEPLIRAIQNKLKLENNIRANDQQRIMVTAGSNMAFSHILFCICDPGDEVIISAPFYFNHEMAIHSINCRPIEVPTNDHYLPNIADYEKLVTPKTRAIVTISPNNPTGAVYPEPLLRQINRLCQDRGIYHISDEAYEYFTYNDTAHFSPGSIAGSDEHTISLFSLSKSFGMASWRIGYMVFPHHLYESASKIQDTQLICPTVLAQYAALSALEKGRSYYLAHRRQIDESRSLFLDRLNGIADYCTCPVTHGAFYFLLKINTSLDDLDLAERLIREFGVATIPGNTFGITDGCYLRIAYGALDSASAKEGIDRLVKGITALVARYPGPNQ